MYFRLLIKRYIVWNKKNLIDKIFENLCNVGKVRNLEMFSY